MHTEHLRNLTWQFFFNVFSVTFVIKFIWIWGLEQVIQQVEVWQEQFRLEEHFEISCIGPSVPIISNVTTVHNLTKDVFEILPWNHIILAQIIVQHISTNGQVTIVEIVNSTPTLTAEFLSSQNQ
jgi:hypothetical protein